MHDKACIFMYPLRQRAEASKQKQATKTGREALFGHKPVPHQTSELKAFSFVAKTTPTHTTTTNSNIAA